MSVNPTVGSKAAEGRVAQGQWLQGAEKPELSVYTWDSMQLRFCDLSLCSWSHDTRVCLGAHDQALLVGMFDLCAGHVEVISGPVLCSMERSSVYCHGSQASLCCVCTVGPGPRSSMRTGCCWSVMVVMNSSSAILCSSPLQQGRTSYFP